MQRDRIIWDRRNADWAAMYGTKSQLESQKKKFFSCKPVGLSSSDGKPQNVRRIDDQSRLYQENHAMDCMEIEELRRICL